jgi:hypothetical protein
MTINYFKLFLLCNFCMLCQTKTCEGSIKLDFVLIVCDGMKCSELTQVGVRFTAFNIIGAVLLGCY